MKIARMLALSAVAFATSTSASLAGPCSAEIDATMVRFNAALEANAAVGSTTSEQQAIVGGRHIQPTPRSIAAAEEQVGEMSVETIKLVEQAMERARAADVGDVVACKEALAEVQRVIGR
jgi:hypothetical protein